MAAAAHKGAIAFGLLYIPVALYTAVSETGISFNQLTRDGKARIKYKKVREDTGEEVPPNEIVKGYQYEKGRYVIITEDELERLKTQKDRNITIRHFCPIGAVDPIYFEKTYYVIPNGGDKAYALLLKAMAEEKKMAVASTVLGTKETLIALLPGENGLVAETMHYLEEIKAVPKPFMSPEIQPAELEMAKALVNTMDKPFQPELYHDHYQERLMEAIQKNINGEGIAMPGEEPAGNVTDIMEALKRSLAERGQMTPPPRDQPYFGHAQ